MSKRSFGELESEILYIMRDGSRKTVKDVHKKLGERNNYNTIMTVMSRLSTKNVLGRERVGLQYEYWTLSSSNPSSIIEKFKQKFFGLKTSELVSYLIESSDDLTESDLIEMEQLLKKARMEKHDQ